MKYLGGIFAALLALLLGAAPAVAQDHVAGDWHGTLTTPRGALRVLLTIREGANGALTGELESIDQAPGQKFAIDAITLSGGHLSFTMNLLHASYAGIWHADGQRFTGTFSQGADMALDFERGAGEARPHLTGVDGIWDGSVVRNGVPIRLVLHFTTVAAGTVASLDSPDLLAAGLPVTELRESGGDLSFTVPSGGAHFRGRVAGDRLSGTWSRPNLPDDQITFTRRQAQAAAVRHPQEPHPPFPYRSEEVRIPNPRAPGVTLAGTLTLPQGTGPFAAAVLITGSGPQDRDESLLGQKPFAVLADYLTRHGIAVLRVDDRGVGQSTGAQAGATSADFATDANAAFALLAARPEIDHHGIGFIGHSEGGMIGPIAARDNPDVAFLVLLAGPGQRNDLLLAGQRRVVAHSQGLSDAELAAADPAQRAFIAAASSDGDAATVGARLRASLDGLHVPAEGQARMVQMATDPWFRYFIRYDPAPNLARLRMPVLALNGSLDQQVIAADNLPGIRAALANDRDVTVREMPGLNHLFQHARTGAPGEYADIEETMSPEVLGIVADWINARFPARH